MYRQKVPSHEVLEKLRRMSMATAGEPIPKEYTLMATETLLHLGSRSFSHFLNATERYLDLLRSITPDPESRQAILEAVANYWQRSSQLRLVTLDKYLQYGVLEGLDVVEWVFSAETQPGEEADGWTDGHQWEILRMVLDKHVGRVNAVKRRVKAVEKEDENARARKAAEKLEQGEGVGEDENVETAEARLERSKEARDAQISLDIQGDKLESILLATTRHFVRVLLPWCFGDEESGLKAVFELLDSDEEGAWAQRCRFGWFREFVRKVSFHHVILSSSCSVTRLLGDGDGVGQFADGQYASHLTPLAPKINDKTLQNIPETPSEETPEGRAEGLVRAVWASLGA